MKVLIVGLGSIAKKHIVALTSLINNVEIFALRSNKSQPSIENIKNIYTLEEVSDLKPNFAIISNPTGEHFRLIDELKQFGIPLFIEKPLFSELNEQAEKLVQLVDTSGITTYVACNLRFLDCITFLKNEILIKEQIKINEVNVYCGSYLPDWRKGVDFRTTYSANKDMGGGVEIDLIHELDYVYWLFGKPQKNTSFFSNQSSLNITANDYANYLWSYSGFCVNVVLNYYRKTAKRQMELVAGEDVWTVDLLKNTIHKNDDIYFESAQTIANTYLSQMDFFINHIYTNKVRFNPINEAFDVLKLCLKN